MPQRKGILLSERGRQASGVKFTKWMGGSGSAWQRGQRGPRPGGWRDLSEFVLLKPRVPLEKAQASLPPHPLLCRSYFENVPKGLDREGWTRGGIQPQKPGGYTLNQPVTRREATPNPTDSLSRLHPHVGR